MLITRRLPNSHLGGLREFPGGRVENGETPPEALKRELIEELDLAVEVGELFWRGTFEYDIKIVDIAFYRCSLTQKNISIKPLGVQAYRWVNTGQIADFDFPPADREVIRRLTRPSGL